MMPRSPASLEFRLCRAAGITVPTLTLHRERLLLALGPAVGLREEEWAALALSALDRIERRARRGRPLRRADLELLRIIGARLGEVEE